MVRAGRTLLSRPRARARTSVPGQRLHHASRGTGPGPARGRARRLRPAGVRPQAVGGARGSPRGAAGSPRRRGHVRATRSTCPRARRTPPARRTCSSGHLTVGVHVTRWRDVLDRRRRPRGRRRSTSRCPPVGAMTSRASPTSSRGRLAALASALGEVDVRAEAGERRERFLSNRAQLARGTIAERAAPIAVDDATVVARRPGTVCELAVRTGSSRGTPRRPTSRDARLVGAERCARSPASSDDGELTVARPRAAPPRCRRAAPCSCAV